MTKDNEEEDKDNKEACTVTITAGIIGVTISTDGGKTVDELVDLTNKTFDKIIETVKRDIPELSQNGMVG